MTNALARLIEGALPLADWVAIVRTTIPPAARRRAARRPSLGRRLVDWVRAIVGLPPHAKPRRPGA